MQGIHDPHQGAVIHRLITTEKQPGICAPCRPAPDQRLQISAYSLILDRKVADKRIFPAIDILKSGTRKEELITPKDVLQKTYVLRRILNPMGPQDAIEFLIDKLRQSKNNADFFQSMNT